MFIDFHYSAFCWHELKYLEAKWFGAISTWGGVRQRGSGYDLFPGAVVVFPGAVGLATWGSAKSKPHDATSAYKC